jgi:hypothetical protein
MRKESKWLWVHGHKGIRGNEISHLLTRMELEHINIYMTSTCNGISAGVSKKTDWMNRKHENLGST